MIKEILLRIVGSIAVVFICFYILDIAEARQAPQNILNIIWMGFGMLLGAALLYTPLRGKGE